MGIIDKGMNVEAYVASWIEMSVIPILVSGVYVEAYVASWIEITRANFCA